MSQNLQLALLAGVFSAATAGVPPAPAAPPPRSSSARTASSPRGQTAKKVCGFNGWTPGARRQAARAPTQSPATMGQE